MGLYAVRMHHEFCVDAETEAEALEIVSREHAMAISDGRCGVMQQPSVAVVRQESDLCDDTLDEVPLNAFDFTARDRLIRD
jgi:hypothetical protein